MARDLNQVFLVGRLTRDVELKTTQSGKSVASFSLAVNRSNDEADFVECVAWEKTAELLDQYVGRGSKILVQGSLQGRSYEAKDGTNRKVWEVIARDVTFLDSKPTENTQTQAQTQTSTAKAKKKDDVVEDIGDEPINLDDIPF